jgi:hypothetical protein
MRFVKQLTKLVGFGAYLRAGYTAGHQKNPVRPAPIPAQKLLITPRWVLPKPTKPGFGGFVSMLLGNKVKLFGTNPDNIHITFPGFAGTSQEELPCSDTFHVRSY